MPDIKLTKLDNGLRIITDRVDSVHSVALGIWTEVGTRHEQMRDNGAAHMIEHMLFKGTEKRSAQQIVEDIENVGGHMNAYTGREITSYHIHLLKDHIPLALDVLADMYQNSVMPEDEMEREREVILQEIGMNSDTPDELVFDNYYEAAYRGQTIGAPILGTGKIISDMRRSTLINYVQQFYTAPRTSIVAAGNLDHDELVGQVAKLFTNLPQNQTHEKPDAQYTAGESREDKELEQAHFILGFEALPRTHDHYYTVQALCNLMGGGMSSRLFQEIREKRGLVYSIYSFYSAYSDNGQFAIYAGTGPDHLPNVIPVICDEIKNIGGSLATDEVERAKAQLKSSILMRRESMMARADKLAKHLVYHDEPYHVEDVINKINQIDLAAIKVVANDIFENPPTLASLGPVKKLEAYDRICDRLKA